MVVRPDFKFLMIDLRVHFDFIGAFNFELGKGAAVALDTDA